MRSAAHLFSALVVVLHHTLRCPQHDACVAGQARAHQRGMSPYRMPLSQAPGQLTSKTGRMSWRQRLKSRSWRPIMRSTSCRTPYLQYVTSLPCLLLTAVPLGDLATLRTKPQIRCAASCTNYPPSVCAFCMMQLGMLCAHMVICSYAVYAHMPLENGLHSCTPRV